MITEVLIKNYEMRKLKIALLGTCLSIGLMVSAMITAKASPGEAKAKTELVKLPGYHVDFAAMQICPVLVVVNQAPALPAAVSFAIERDVIKMPFVKITGLLDRPGWQVNDRLSLYIDQVDIRRKPPLIL